MIDGVIISPWLVTTQNTVMWTGCLIFINIHINVSVRRLTSKDSEIFELVNPS